MFASVLEKKIEQNVHLLLRWCSWVLPVASGHVFRRFGGRFGMDFRCFGERLLGCVFCIETRTVLAGVETALLFGAEFSHSLGIKFALTRTTHPQQPLSKGGGLAKRPQLLLLLSSLLLSSLLLLLLLLLVLLLVLRFYYEY